MTLTKKIAYSVLGLQMVIFVGIYLISLNNERNYFIQQTNNNAKDMATTLGLLLNQIGISENNTMVLTIVDNIFDRGYFSSVELKNTSGVVLASRHLPVQRSKVPRWFIHLIRWPAARSSLPVIKNDKQLGEIFVTSDNNYAYKSLWRNVLLLIFWYLLFALLSLASAYIFIQWLLRPIKRIAEQALAICERKFPIETIFPKTPELKHVTFAMNQMVGRIKGLFEEQAQQIETLRLQAFQDNLTGLGNRRYFLQQLTSLLNNKEEFTPGFMILIIIDELESLNKKQGLQQGDNVVDNVAKVCVNFWSTKEIISLARISENNFALLIRENNTDLFIKRIETFNQLLQGLFYNNSICKVFLAVAPYQLHQMQENLFNELDELLKKAKQAPDRIAYSANIHGMHRLSVTGDLIITALSELKLSLCSQLIIGKKDYYHKEIFARINLEDQQISAGYFMPIAEKSGIAYLIDQFVLAKITVNGHLSRDMLALNVADETVLNSEYQADYVTKLENLPLSLRKNLYIELKEELVLNYFTKVTLFVKILQSLEIKVGIDQVGIHFSPMHYLSELPISYLKLHGSLIHDVIENQNKQFFIHYFSEMAKILDIQLIATQVENEKQWQVLQELHLKWGQGQYLNAVEFLN
ncbi:bifunctional diguanylate cyclase/phosphodiesterase [Legionella fairfieldensis]|uniref:bifunctional diguanylate cyclase/phosphodiesterase n=1 Tax=Legionella fairfieldensis TaxID=45064 RepID=UPI00048B33A4|nr:EAL domain-containing protein [Legionella fairfieldensis]